MDYSASRGEKLLSFRQFCKIFWVPHSAGNCFDLLKYQQLLKKESAPWSQSVSQSVSQSCKKTTSDFKFAFPFHTQLYVQKTPTDPKLHYRKARYNITKQ